MKEIIIATQNQGKVKEIKQMLAHLDVEVKTMQEAGIDIDIEENGKTFKENAVIKVEALTPLTSAIVIADDSGLEIDYLNKEPGVYSARYLGKDTPYEEKNKIILERLKDVRDELRTARFVCAMAIGKNGCQTITTEGILEGYIGDHIAGTNGFGYDPIFFPKGSTISTAQLTKEQKNQISHRGKALKQLTIEIEKMLEL